MAKPKSVTIKLTEKQRRQFQELTGEDHTEIKLEAAPAIGSVKRAASLTAGKSVSIGLAPDTGPGLQTFRIDR